MAGPSNPSYVLEMPLATTPSDERRLERGLFEAAKRLNNSLLQSGLEIVDAIRSDPRWGVARNMAKGTEEQRKARSAAFGLVRIEHGFSDYAFQALAIQHKNAAGFAGRIGANATQKLGTKVFRALEQHLLGTRGKPRFKGAKRPLHSVEDKNNDGHLRWSEDDGCLYINAKWAIPARLPDLKKDEWFWSALKGEAKYCRVLWRDVRGTRRYFVQLVMDGKVPIKASLLARLAEPGTKGALDIGPSNIAWCTDTDAGLFKFCADVDEPAKLIRRLQRKVDRQRRANNPENFDAKGSPLRGKRWARSKRQKTTEADLRSIRTHQAEKRANAHGRDINLLLEKARHFRHDGVSVKSLQRIYGKSVGARAPGRFMSELQRKAESAGGGSDTVNVRQLKTSQYDHSTGESVKKTLSERWHVFGDGRGSVQRDVYSAFLALHACRVVGANGVEAWSHDQAKLQATWLIVEPALRARGLFRDLQRLSTELPLGKQGDRSSICRLRDPCELSNREARPLRASRGLATPGVVRAKKNPSVSGLKSCGDGGNAAPA